eukprot:3736928-Pleurochrysis_carterae.AAC.1
MTASRASGMPTDAASPSGMPADAASPSGKLSTQLLVSRCATANLDESASYVLPRVLRGPDVRPRGCRLQCHRRGGDASHIARAHSS